MGCKAQVLPWHQVGLGSHVHRELVPRESAGALQGGVVAPLVFLHQHWCPLCLSLAPRSGAEADAPGSRMTTWPSSDRQGSQSQYLCGEGRGLAVSVPQPCGCC